MYFDTTETDSTTGLASGTWILDPERSSLELRVRGTLDLAADPAIELAVDAHPEVRSESDSAALEGEAVHIKGLLYAAGESVPLDLTATVVPAGEEFEIEAHAEVDQHRLGMTDGPPRMPRQPARLLLRGRLVRW